MDGRATDAERRALLLRLARRDVPEILVWAGGLTLLFGVVNYFARPDEPASAWVINLVFGPLFLVLSWALRHPKVPDSAVPWVWALSSTLLVGMLVNAFRLDPTPANLAYAAAAMTALGPLTNAWLPFVCSSAAMLVISAGAFAATPAVVFSDTFLVCVAAVLISALLLRMRINSVRALADTQAQAEHQAMFDPMTDVLNRNGLERSIPAMVGTARRRDEALLVWFIDVRGLKAANDRHGHDFGDMVILAVTEALHACVRTNDLVSRWGGDEFVVMGVGAQGSAVDLNDRMNAVLQRDARVSDRWPGTVTVGYACGPADADPHALIAEADTDMYRRRIAPFAGEPS